MGAPETVASHGVGDREGKEWQRWEREYCGEGSPLMDRRFLQSLEVAPSLPRFLLALSRVEKEDDVQSICGTKLSQRPRRRSKGTEKLVQVSPPVPLPPEWEGVSGTSEQEAHTCEQQNKKECEEEAPPWREQCSLINPPLLLLSRLQRILPGAWLSNISLERYEVRERRRVRKVGGGMKMGWRGEGTVICVC